MKDLTVYVLTHNRGRMLLETIDSVLNQTCRDFTFIVSDNSNNNDTYELLKENGYIEKLNYVKRKEECSGLEHLDICLSEVKTKYFVLFHDDDIMLPNYVQQMYDAVQKGYPAVGSNAYFLYGGKKSKKTFFGKGKNIEVSKKQLPIQYCKNIISPFPSYIYNKELLKGLHITNECGKYSDVIWLLKVSEAGNVLWLSTPLMYYRIHKEQDSKSLDIENQEKLIECFKNIVGDGNKYLRKYETILFYLKMWLDYKKRKVINKSDMFFLFAHSKFLFCKFVLKLILFHRKAL